MTPHARSISEPALRPTALAIAFVFGTPVGMVLFSVLGLPPAVGGFLLAGLVFATFAVARFQATRQGEAVDELRSSLRGVERSSLDRLAETSEAVRHLCERMEHIQRQTAGVSAGMLGALPPFWFPRRTIEWMESMRTEGMEPAEIYNRLLQRNVIHLLGSPWVRKPSLRDLPEDQVEARLALAASLSMQLVLLLDSRK